MGSSYNSQAQADSHSSSSRIPYTPIDSARKQIRLAILAPGAFGDPIVVRLQTVYLVSTSWFSLFSQPNYEALSYFWGQDAHSHTAIVNGVDMNISMNLDSALRHLRSQDGHRTLWIDALCINQSDVDEKNAQVQIMTSVYQSASKVIVWLGPEGRNGPIVDYILYDPLSRGWSTLHYLALLDMCQRDWFERVWVVQELTMARYDPEVRLGRQSLPWSTFTSFMDDVDTWKLDNMDLHYQLRIAARRIKHLARLRRNQSWVTFTSQLALTAGFLASEPRDKVYAILGMNRAPTSTPKITVDYNKPIRQVFIEASLHLLREDPHTTYYHFPLQRWHFQNSKQLSGTDGLPSWAIDFELISQQLRRKAYFNLPHRYMKADGDVYKGSNTDPPFITDSNLKTTGTRIGVIIATSQGLLQHLSGPCPAQDLKRIIDGFLIPNHVPPMILLKLVYAVCKKPDYKYWHASNVRHLFDLFVAGSCMREEDEESIQRVIGNLLQDLRELVLFITSAGHLGITYHPDANNGIRIGDELVGLFGNSIPFVLRRLQSGHYQMINVTHVQRFKPCRCLDDHAASFGTEETPCNTESNPFPEYTYIIE